MVQPIQESDRDFSSMKLGTRVRFAKALRVIETCRQCGLPGVPLVSVHMKRKRYEWIHHAITDSVGFVAQDLCVAYEQPPQKRPVKKRRSRK